jgi:hypothetical protein
VIRPWESVLEVELSAAALWDEGVEAARNACVAGAPLASAAIAAAAFYDSPLVGGRAMLAAMARFTDLALDLPAWLEALRPGLEPESGETGFVPGFGYANAAREAAVLSAGEALRAHVPAGRLAFCLEQRRALREHAGPLNVAGLCALLFLDAGLDAQEAELRFLLLRLRPALEAAQRAKRAGLTGFPFFEDGYAYEGRWPETRITEPCSDEELEQLKKAVGLAD